MYLKYNEHKGPDGYSSWKEFKEGVCTRPSFHNPYSPGNDLYLYMELIGKKGANIDTNDGGLITLYPDGTWGYDCAPDWNGAS